MDLDHARALVAVANTGSVSAAANCLGTTRPTVRRRLSALEESLGVTLAVPSAAGMEITETGALYVEHARPILRDHDALHALVTSSDEEPTGVLDMAVPIGAAMPLASMMLGLAQNLWPKLRFSIRSTHDPVTELDQGAHAALTLNLPSKGDFVVHAVARSEWSLFASEAYLSHHGTPETAQDLARHELIRTPVVDGRPGWPLRGGGHLAIEPRLTTTDFEMARSCVSAGRGIGMFTPMAASGLVPVLQDEVGMSGTIWWVTTKANALLPRVRCVSEQALKILGPLLKTSRPPCSLVPGRGRDVA